MKDGSDELGRRVHVVVTCANRKRREVPGRLQLRALATMDAERRGAEWVRRLTAESPTVPAMDLYAGEHWQVARGLADAAGPGARLWVCSAGYGLIPVGASIHPYAATFSSGQPDSAGGSAEEVRDWWRRLARWPGPQPGQPRSFLELADRDPDSSIVAVLSEAYLRACARDLRNAAARMTDADSMSVIGPADRCPEVDDLLVPVTAVLRPAVGGSLQALNVRAADHVLRAARETDTPLRRPLLGKLMADATASAPEDTGRRPVGARLNDEEVRDFIRASIRFGPASATGLLRRLRGTGQSCEQSRFKMLFTEVVSSEEFF